MAETLTVALRVAEEAIEEAIAKAEEFSDSLVRLPSDPPPPFSPSLSLIFLLLVLSFLLLFFPSLLPLSWPLTSSRCLPLGPGISGMQSWFLAETSSQTLSW